MSCCASFLPSLEKDDMNKSRLITIGSAAAVLALTAGTASAATTMITGHDIQDGTVRKVDLSAGINRTLTKAALPGTTGTVYRVAHYGSGAGNDAIATVSCADSDAKSQKYVAISGGVQMVGADGDTTLANDNDIPVADSFPGRMDWDTYTPKAGRLDGWVVRLGDTAATQQINVWAICVKKPADLQVQTTNY
jgi:hypothetical protein